MAHQALKLALRNSLSLACRSQQVRTVSTGLRTVPQFSLQTHLFKALTRSHFGNKYSTEQREPPRPWDEVSSAQLLSGIRNKELFLFDLRTPEEVNKTGQMPGATNIPASELVEAVKLSADEFKAKYQVEMPGKFEQNFIIHCCSGIRSSQVVKALHEAGFVLARHYRGGWKGYQELNTEDIEKLRPWTDVNYEELMSLIRAKEVQLFDVRTVKETARTGMMPGATNVPMAEVGEAFRLNADEFREEYGVELPSKEDDNVIIHCLGGIRSLKTLGVLWEAGYQKVRHYPGGWEEYITRTTS
ncbi:uncharacterized protein [Watersipora subatra]|uniref:uncharacterized protein isoform X2 n=1 Tax=Watersipora subatra TaxID=2589382 RepID=UPI00355C506A